MLIRSINSKETARQQKQAKQYEPQATQATQATQAATQTTYSVNPVYNTNNTHYAHHTYNKQLSQHKTHKLKMTRVYCVMAIFVFCCIFMFLQYLTVPFPNVMRRLQGATVFECRNLIGLHQPSTEPAIRVALDHCVLQPH